MKNPGRSFWMLVALVPLACVSNPFHERPEQRWLHWMTGRASAPLREPKALPPDQVAFEFARTIRVAVYADCHGNAKAHRRIVEAIREQEPDLVVFAGDALTCLPVGHLPDLGAAKYLVPAWPQYLRGHPEFSLVSIIPFPALAHEVLGSPCGFPHDPNGFNRFLEITAPLRLEDGVPLLFAPGNHDTYFREDRDEIARTFGSPAGVAGTSPDRLWYATDAGGWRFVVLDSGTDLPFESDPLEEGGAQLEWLEGTLCDAERCGLHVAITMHCPPYSSATEDPPNPRLDERVVRDILDRHSVELVLSGHEHAWERLERNGVTYVVTGGGGGRFDADVPQGKRDPRSRSYVAGEIHYVLLELGADGWCGSALTPEGRDLDRFGPGLPDFETVSLR